MPTDTGVPTPERTVATVVEVVDGDTIKVVVDGQLYTVRYIGMDTPEQYEQLGPEASAQNAKLVLGKTVELEKDVSETDRYGRLLRYVWVGELMVNAELVRLGYANASTYPPDVKYQTVFRTLELAARDAGVGFWSPQAEPTTPPAVPTATMAVAQMDVVIRDIFYDGVVAQVESDEYAEILNRGTAPVNLARWRLNAGNPGQDFFFPDFVLQPGQMCRVYTNEVHPETGGFSFRRGAAIWYNKGDCGYLYDATGKLVSELCY
jgi:endonuclease YncB( thermonuclease family)